MASGVQNRLDMVETHFCMMKQILWVDNCGRVQKQVLMFAVVAKTSKRQ